MSESENTKKHKGFKLSILLLLIVGVVFLKEENRDKLLSLVNSLRGSEIQVEIANSINLPAAKNIGLYKHTISVWSENKLSLFDIGGDLKMEKQFDFQDPLAYFGDDFIYISDRSTGYIYKIDSQDRAQDRTDIYDDLFNVKEDSHHTIIHKKSPDDESVYIYDKHNVLIGNQSFRDKSIMTYSVDKGGEYAISSLSLNGDSLKSTLALYGKNNQELYSLDIDSEIILYSQFVKKQDILVLSDSSIYFIRDGEIIWQRSFNLIKDIYIGDKIYILHSNYLESIDYQGKTIDKIGFARDLKKIAPFKRDMAVYGPDGFNLVSNGKELFSYDLEIDMLCFGENKIIILKGDKLDIYKVNKK